MLRITNLTLARGVKRLLEGANLTIHTGHKVGLVGSNGCGKSSLFAAIRQELLPDAGSIALPPSWTIAHVAQETPAVAVPAIDYVLDGDRELREIEGCTGRRGTRSLARRRSAGGPAPSLRRHRRLQLAGARGHAAGGPGLSRGAARGPRAEFLRRMAHAPESRAGADVPLRSSAARRADQPSRPRCGAVARGLARKISGNAAAHHPRPGFPGRRRRPDRPRVRAQAHRLHRQLRAVRSDARAAAGAAAGLVRQAAAAGRAPAFVHRPLPRQGHQGQAGAEPDQGAGAHGADRRRARGQSVRVRVSARRRGRAPARPARARDAGLRGQAAGARQRRLGHSRGRPHRAPGTQRRGQVDAAQSDRGHAGSVGREAGRPRRT